MKSAPQRFHFLGICGTAMGGVAVALHDRGCVVTGSDEKVYPPMSDFLRTRGIPLTEPYGAENIPDDAEVVVIGNAIKRGNPEVEAVLNRKLYYLSLPEVLKEFFLRGRHNLVVTGTHGKTTSSALLTWMLTVGELEPGYVVGGLPRNLGQGALFNDSKYFVIEGDEYDTAFFDKRSKFIHYLPELLLINNIEFDHADIFADLDAVKLSFRRLVNIVPQNGMILLNGDDQNCVEVAQDCLAPIVEVGFSENCGERIRDVSYSPTGSRFSLGETSFESPLIGEFNVRNAAMAAVAARFYGLTPEVIQTALTSFEGIARRQEVRGSARGVTVIDDFGHHPTAIRETLGALRHRYPGHRLWAIFEPRSNTTRRAVFQQQLPEALQLADGVFIAQIAALEQIPAQERLDPEAVVAAIAEAGRMAFYERDATAILDRLVPLLQPNDVVTIFSNGGFDGIHGKLLERLAE
ncbi:MAG: UDP-N-acetylmuramate:L-alanyl-gamma-D-glutamyl-meso-diaminopimelate ligase [Chthoniobacterales bacterium]|nr:UDP-N-acetylmuramate:L-alanyl-gamma-D-glutamyl-meso-diaminopimelate ligase [Chthoniobacterales bacterium]